MDVPPAETIQKLFFAKPIMKGIEYYNIRDPNAPAYQEDKRIVVVSSPLDTPVKGTNTANTWNTMLVKNIIGAKFFRVRSIKIPHQFTQLNQNFNTFRWSETIPGVFPAPDNVENFEVSLVGNYTLADALTALATAMTLESSSGTGVVTYIAAPYSSSTGLAGITATAASDPALTWSFTFANTSLSGAKVLGFQNIDYPQKALNVQQFTSFPMIYAISTANVWVACDELSVNTVSKIYKEGVDTEHLIGRVPISPLPFDDATTLGFYVNEWENPHDDEWTEIEVPENFSSLNFRLLDDFGNLMLNDNLSTLTMGVETQVEIEFKFIGRHKCNCE